MVFDWATSLLAQPYRWSDHEWTVIDGVLSWEPCKDPECKLCKLDDEGVSHARTD